MKNQYGNHVINMYYAKVNSNGTSQPITASSTTAYNYSGDGYNWVAYFDYNNPGARVGKGCNINVYNEAGYCSASIHSFMMFGGGTYSAMGDYYINGVDGTPTSASVGADSYIQQIFNTASVTF